MQARNPQLAAHRAPRVGPGSDALATARHALASAEADAAGDAFEAMIEAQHGRAAAEDADPAVRLAYALKIGPPVRFRAPGDATPVGYGGADWIGQTIDGVPLVAETKSSLGNLARTAVKPHQADHLAACARGMGLALLVWEWRGGGAGPHPVFAVPWEEVPWVRRGAGSSIAPDDVKNWRLGADELYFAPALARFRARRGAPPP